MFLERISDETIRVIVFIILYATSAYGTVRLIFLLVDNVLGPLSMKLAPAVARLIDLIFFSTKKSIAKYEEYEKSRMEHAHMMAFYEGGYYPNEEAKTKKTYTFCPYICDEADDFFDVSKDIIEELLSSYKTITHIRSQEWKSLGKNPVISSSAFPYKYYRFLKAHSMENGAFISKDSCDAKEILTLSQGADMPLFLSVIDEGIMNHEYTIYGYSDYPSCELTFETLKDSINNEEYDISLSYQEFHDYLLICFDPKKIDAYDLTETIKIICEKHGKTLNLNS